MAEVRFTTETGQVERSGTPLRDFWGELKEVVPQSEPSRDGGEPRLSAMLRFVSVEVKKSVTPYPFPVAELSLDVRMGRSGRVSDWCNYGRVLVSAEALGIKDLKLVYGKRIHMVATPRPVTRKNKETGEETTVTYQDWAVAELGGGGSTMSEAEKLEAIVALADGKSAGEFASAALADPKLASVHDAVIAQTLLPGLVAVGRLTLDNGKFHKKV